MCGGGDSAPAPDNTAMAAASEKAAVLGKELGDAQLAEAKRQYDQNYAVAKPVADVQLGLMNQTKLQGDDYYNYMKGTFRPIEEGLAADAVKEGSDARMEEQAGTAMADARRGQSQQANMMVRQGLRYGYSPAKMAAMAGQMAGANSSAVAGAATNARNQQRNLGWARRMDVTGLGRNLPGTANASYGLASGAGSAAIGSTMAPGASLMNGMAQGAGMQQKGMDQQINGLGQIMQAQTSAYNNSGGGDDGGGLGSIIGAGVGAWGKMGFPGISDRRLKEDIILVGKDEKTGLNLYEFKYRYCNDDTRFRGVMADEVESIMPDAVIYDDLGFASVNYGMLGVQMVEV